jgi:acetyl esterase/lipase
MSAGISDWGMLVATGEAGTLEASLGGSCGWEGTGPHPHDQISPISFASRIRTPVLIVHGEDDTNVPIDQAIFFHRALSQFGAEHEFVVYPREGHGLGGAQSPARPAPAHPRVVRPVAQRAGIGMNGPPPRRRRGCRCPFRSRHRCQRAVGWASSLS